MKSFYTKLCAASVILSLCLSTPSFAKKNELSNNQALGNQLFNDSQKESHKKHYAQSVKLLKLSAEQNNSEALYYLGLLYEFSSPYRPEKPDFEIAFSYFARSAKLGNAEAKKALRSLKMQGYGNTSEDEIVELRKITESAIQKQGMSDQDRIAALTDLIFSYLSFKRENLQDINKAEYYIYQALKLPLPVISKQILADEINGIAILYLVGTPKLKMNAAHAFQWLKIGASLGSKYSYYVLSDLYFYGCGASLDVSKSREMIAQANKLPGNEKAEPMSMPYKTVFLSLCHLKGWIS